MRDSFYSIFIIFFLSINFSQPQINLGDVNNDGEVNVIDIVLTIQIVLGNFIPSESQENAGDFNGDSVIDVLDIVQIVDFILLHTEECTCDDEPITGSNQDWGLNFAGDSTVPAFPDAFVNYFTWSIAMEPGQGIKIQGEFANARYMSYNLYESTVGQTLNEIFDIQIMPDCCSINPFVETQSMNDNNYYTLYILEEDTPQENYENVFTFPSSIDSLSIFLRYYDASEDNYGGVDLPFITVFDIETEIIIEDPDVFNLTDLSEVSQFEDILVPLFPVLQLDNNLRFYNFSSGNVFANANTYYLATGITRESEDEVYMIRFLPPTFPESVDDYPNSNVRYWSVNQGNEDTRNFLGMMDQKFVIAQSDGFINIVIAEPTEEILSHSEGLNFMPWSVPNQYLFLIYRNLLQQPEYDGHFDQIPLFNQENIGGLQDLYNFNAVNFIGDYAPVGLRMTVSEFLENFGGFPVSY